MREGRGKNVRARSLTSITATNPSVMVSTAVPGNDVLLDQYCSQPILQEITSEILHQSPGEIACRTIARCENTTALINKHTEAGGRSGNPHFKNDGAKVRTWRESDKTASQGQKGELRVGDDRKVR